jgi:hypothetical protein
MQRIRSMIVTPTTRKFDLPVREREARSLA